MFCFGPKQKFCSLSWIRTKLSNCHITRFFLLISNANHLKWFLVYSTSIFVKLQSPNYLCLLLILCLRRLNITALIRRRNCIIAYFLFFLTQRRPVEPSCRYFSVSKLLPTYVFQWISIWRVKIKIPLCPNKFWHWFWSRR